MGLRGLAKCVRASGEQAHMAFLQGAPTGRLGLESSSGLSPVRLPRPARQETEQVDAREEGSLGYTARLSRRVAKTCEVVCVSRWMMNTKGFVLYNPTTAEFYQSNDGTFSETFGTAMPFTEEEAFIEASRYTSDILVYRVHEVCQGIITFYPHGPYIHG